MARFTVDEMNSVRRLMGYTYEQIASASDIPLSTVQKVLGKQTPRPREKTLAALGAALQKLIRDDEASGNIIHEAARQYMAGSGREDETVKDRISYSGIYSEPQENNSRNCWLLRDHPSEYGYGFDARQGLHTLEEYDGLPEKCRVELIDGVFYEMTGATVIHQKLVNKIGYRLTDYIEKNRGQCEVFTASPDVKLFDDRADIVLPDISVVCDRKKLGKRIFGAPDLVVEILSPSSREKEMGLKLKKYREAGVREYWIIDPDRKSLVKTVFGEPEQTFLYGPDAKVPVEIWNGECEVDFAELYESIAYLYDENPAVHGQDK